MLDVIRALDVILAADVILTVSVFLNIECCFEVSFRISIMNGF